MIVILAPSATTLVVQLSSIIRMTAAEYGFFSLFYIVLAIGSACVYSVVSEAWVGDSPSEDSWAQYSTMLISVCGLAMLPALTLGVLAGRPFVGCTLAIAVACSLYRLGVRYFSVYCGSAKGVVRADLVSFAVVMSVLVVLRHEVPSLVGVATAWALASVSSVLLSKRPEVQFRAGIVVAWFRSKWPRIRVLASDSLLIEIGLSGVPLFLAPQMGLANFGVYRAVSSAGVPVRMILNPMRPILAKGDLGKLVGSRRAVQIVGVGLMLGTGVYVALYAVEWLGLFGGTTVAMLTALKAPVGLFVACYWFDTFYYLTMRSRLGWRAVIGYRAVQLSLNIVLPIGGYYVGGLDGAVWGYVGANLFVTPIALFNLRRSRSRDK